MKHVFVIGSHTPFLTAMGVIKKNKLKPEECIFIWGRKYKTCIPIPDFKNYDLSERYYICIKGNNRNRIKETIHKIDDFINDEIGDNYTLYIPHLAFYFFQVFATNSLCKDIKFIQEGIADFCISEKKYTWPTFKNIYVNMRYMINGRIWDAKGWNDYQCNVKHVSETFALSDRLFTEMNCKHTIIKWPQTKLNLSLDKNGVFFIFESLVEQKNIEREIFMQATYKLIKKYGSQINYVKFHPYQQEENKQAICTLFTKLGMSVQELPNEIPFELILSNQQHMKVCGFTTSLIFFAALMPQHETHICASTLYISKKFLTKYWRKYNATIQKIYKGHFKYENLNG